MKWFASGLGLTVVLALTVSPGTAGDKPEGTVVKIDDLTSTTPATWKMEKPANRLRSHQFKVLRAEGDPADAELVVMPDLRGSHEQNLERWRDLFVPPADKKPEEIAKLDRWSVGKVKVVYLDIAGTYLSLPRPLAPKSQATPKPGYRMLAVIFETPENSHKISLIGPARTVEQHKKGFDAWLKAFK